MITELKPAYINLYELYLDNEEYDVNNTEKMFSEDEFDSYLHLMCSHLNLNSLSCVMRIVFNNGYVLWLYNRYTHYINNNLITLKNMLSNEYKFHLNNMEKFINILNYIEN